MGLHIWPHLQFGVQASLPSALSFPFEASGRSEGDKEEADGHQKQSEADHQQ
jgi:hypothetical protein